MSAPTSLMMSNPNTNANNSNQNQNQTKEQQQQLIDNLYATTFAAEDIEIAGLERQLLKSSSNKQLNVAGKQQVTCPDVQKSSSGSKLHHRHPQLQHQHLELINVKFNELARKILDELKQVQYSREFFKAVDEIISEPICRSYASSHQRNVALKRRRAAGLGDEVKLEQRARFAPERSNQPQSLPVESLVTKQAGGREASKSPAKSSIPTSTVTAAAINLNTPVATAANNRSKLDPSAASPIARPSMNPISKSATVQTGQPVRPTTVQKSTSSSLVRDRNVDSNRGRADASSTKFPSQNYTPAAPAANLLHNVNSLLKAPDGSSPISDNDADSDSQEDGYSADCTSPVDLRQTFGRHSFKGGNYNNPKSSDGHLLPNHQVGSAKAQTVEEIVLKHQQQQQRSSFNPLVRSHTMSSANRREVQQNPRVSSTGGSANDSVASMLLRNINNSANFNGKQHLATANLLNGKEAAASLSLYKPHMNYSTSVLGNHRLSDDDEIIIIPTMQSPSSLISSTSPDNNYQGGADGGGDTADELSERFSISRTKSFWEKLSKGSNGKRGAGGGERIQSPNALIQMQMATGEQMGPIDQVESTAKKQPQTSTRFSKASSNTGASSTGNPLDRMDSTGGSNNSNYSCSSSGDENTSGPLSYQNHPIVSKFIQQELNRQNRFRQTR